MEKIRVVMKRVGESDWELAVLLGRNEARGVGFSVYLNKEYWKNITGGVCSPERLTRITFDFLLHKKGSAFALDRTIYIERLHTKFPDYEDEVHKKLVGAFGL